MAALLYLNGHWAKESHLYFDGEMLSATSPRCEALQSQTPFCSIPQYPSHSAKFTTWQKIVPTGAMVKPTMTSELPELTDGLFILPGAVSKYSFPLGSHD